MLIMRSHLNDTDENARKNTHIILMVLQTYVTLLILLCARHYSW